MKLTCFELQNPIEITEGKIFTLVLENPTFYRNFIGDLLLQSNGESDRFSLYDENGDYDIRKNAEIITDIFNISFDSRQISNKINQIVTDEFYLSEINAEKLLSGINEIGTTILSRLDFNAIYNPIEDVNGILKLFGFSFDYESLSLVERIMEYLDFLNRYFDKKLFILINLKTILSQSEYSEFVKFLNYKKIKVLLIEDHKREIQDRNEEIRIIDTELCEF